jgi:hypothetical protein
VKDMEDNKILKPEDTVGTATRGGGWRGSSFDNRSKTHGLR